MNQPKLLIAFLAIGLAPFVGCGRIAAGQAPLDRPAVQRPGTLRDGDRRAVNRGPADGKSLPIVDVPRIPEGWPAYRAWTMREVTIDALGRIGAAAVPALVEVLADPNPVVRRRAAQALARIGPDARDAVPDLIVTLQDRNEEVRKSAARALGQIGPDARAAIPALMDELKAAPADAAER